MTTAPGPLDAGTPREPHLQALHHRTYGLRILGMGLGSLPVIVVLHDIHASWPAWAWMLLGCFAWPHLAYLLARRSRDPLRAELRNLVADSFFAGSCAPLMHFNLLPSVVLVAVVTADKVITGVRGLWLRSLWWMLAGVLVIGAFEGFAVQPYSSMAVVLASLPILVIHTLVVSLISYRLVRRVQAQNRRLRELAHTDPLTGLHTRRHWEQAVGAMLAQPDDHGSATLLLMDLDIFKVINDTHGHTVGDDVLRSVGAIVMRHSGRTGLAGRLGGDEIALVLPIDAAAASAVAEHLRAEVEALQFPQASELRCTMSIGIAPRSAETTTCRSWVEAADHALYRAKHGGRNRVGSLAATSASP